MNLQEFKEAIQYRVTLMKAFAIYTFQQELAYSANNWGNVLSTTFYMLSTILFINILYANVDLIAGYSKNQMLFFLFVGQVGFYTLWFVFSNLQEFILDINKGNLDLLLVRPAPTMLFVSFRKIKLFSTIRDAIPPTLALTLAINWNDLALRPVNLVAGIMICFLGLIAVYLMHFIATLPAFWIGESSNILSLSAEVEYNVGKIIPLEGYGKEMKILFGVGVPVLISTGFATSVMLGKSAPTDLLLASMFVVCGFFILRQLLWKVALRAYTSASS
jgi:ABC-2 type transport system permease protein